MHRLFLPTAVLSVSLACIDDVGQGKAAAEVAEPVAEAEAAQVAPTATVLAVDPARSTLRALGAKITATHPVVIHAWNGEVAMDGETPVKLSFTADVASLEADHPKLTTHLKDADFLWVDKFPEATFVSTKIAEGSDAEGMTHTVTGNLSIRGKAMSVTFPAKVSVAPETVSAETEFVIDRQDFGITYPGRPDDLVQDNVVMTVSWVAPRA